MIENAYDIEALRETKGAVDKSLSDLPRRRADLATRITRLQELQRELAWPAEEASLVKERLPQRVRVAELRAFLEARSALDATLAGTVADETAARQSLEMLQAQLAELPPEKDFGELSAALKFARSLGDIEGVLRTVQRDENRRHAALSTAMAQLQPWSGEVDALRKLILPTDGEAATALADVARADMANADAKRNHQTELNRKSDLELQRLHLVRDDSAVSPQAVHDVRQDRDALWRQVRAHLTDENALPDPAAAADDFERRTAIADGVADRRFSAAEQSARFTALQEEIEHNALALTQQTERVAQADAEVEAVTRDWQALTARSGLQMTPKAFGTWSEQRRRVLEAAKEHEAALDALKDANAQIQDGRMRLVTALTAAGARPADETSFAQIIQAAERLEALGSNEAQQRRDLGVAIAAATAGLKRAETKLLAARQSLGEWENQWDRAVNAAELHSEASHAVVRTQLDLIEELRADVGEILSLQQRIADMDRDVADFGAQVAALAQACGVKADGRSPTDLLTVLASASREAADLQTRHKNLELQLATAESRLADADITPARALARLQPFSEIAGTADRAALSAAVHRAQRARDLREESDRLVEEILKAGAGPELAILLTEIENAEAPELAVRSSELEEELTALSEEIARLTGDRATAQVKFERLDDGPDAAVAAADAEQARAEMAVQAEAYVRKRAEAALLRWAIARYRAEKQTPLLKRASDLFSMLTLGHYTHLLVDLEGDKARLAGLAQDQAVVAVDGMSEGTVDQLFLALRLAAVEDAVASGSKLPFLADDLFINYDDNRAAAGFQVLAELAKKTQVIFFTHHQHLLAVARGALASDQISVCTLA